MSNLQLNLKVLTDHLTELATKQQKGADQVTGANRHTGDVTGLVERTHGLICAATTSALAPAEAGRKSAGEALHRVSTELAAKLTTAAVNYNDTDYRAGTSIGQICGD